MFAELQLDLPVVIAAQLIALAAKYIQAGNASVPGTVSSDTRLVKSFGAGRISSGEKADVPFAYLLPSTHSKPF